MSSSLGQLAFPLLRTAINIGGAILLFSSWGYLSTWAGSSFSYLVWVLVPFSILLLASDLMYWLGQGPGLRLVFSLTGVREASTEQDRERRIFAVLLTQQLLRNSAWPFLLYGTLTVVPRVGETLSSRLDLAGLLPYLGVFHDLAPWAMVVVIPLVIARIAGNLWRPVIKEVLPIPWWRLLGLASLFVLLAPQGLLSVSLGFNGVGLLLPSAIALGLSYVGEAFLRSTERPEIWAFGEQSKTPMFAAVVALVSQGVWALAAALVLWGVLNALAEVGTALLAHQEMVAQGRVLYPYLLKLYEVRYFATGLWLAVVIVILGTPPAAQDVIPGELVSFIRVAVLIVAGSLAWLTGTELAFLGHAFLLAGAATAAGLFAVAGAEVARRVLARWASQDGLLRWLLGSDARVFFIGAALAFYGLLLRPVFYEHLWFAPIYEWLVVLSIAVVLFRRTTQAMAAGSVATEDAPAHWPSWTRHQQQVEERPDVHFEDLLGLQEKYVKTGDWSGIWERFLWIMLRNEMPITAISPVFQPVYGLSITPVSRLPEPGKASKQRTARQSALIETVSRMKAAMASPRSSLNPIDESQIRQAATPFVQEGRDPGPLAVLLTAAYWQQRADLTKAIALWFLLMSYSDDPVKWFQPLWFRNKVMERNYQRRVALVEGAIGHLYGGLRLRRLPVALPERASRVFSRPNMGADTETSLTPQWPVEILSANRGYYRVRTHNNFRGYIPVGSLVRQKLLPHDE